MAVGTLSYCLGSVWCRPLLRHSGPMAVGGMQMLIGGSFLVVLSGAFERPGPGQLAGMGSPVFLLSLAWTTLVGGAAALVIYLRLIRDWGPTRAGMYAFVTPIVATALGAGGARRAAGTRWRSRARSCCSRRRRWCSPEGSPRDRWTPRRPPERSARSGRPPSHAPAANTGSAIPTRIVGSRRRSVPMVERPFRIVVARMPVPRRSTAGSRAVAPADRSGVARGNEQASTRSSTSGAARFGGGKPLICSSLIGRSAERIAIEARSTLAKGADVLEWRVDFFDDIGDTQAVLATARGLRAAIGDTPLIFTRRATATPASRSRSTRTRCFASTTRSPRPA